MQIEQNKDKKVKKM